MEFIGCLFIYTDAMLEANKPTGTNLSGLLKRYFSDESGDPLRNPNPLFDVSPLLQDPLSPQTRKEKRNLLAASLVGLVIFWTNVQPSEIDIAGISFGVNDCYKFFLILIAVILYLLITFLAYARTDNLAWRSTGYNFLLSEWEHNENDDSLSELISLGFPSNDKVLVDQLIAALRRNRVEKKIGSLRPHMLRNRLVRSILDYVVPPLFACFVLGSLVYRLTHVL